MKTYELAYIISPEATSEEVEAKSREIESAIQSREGIIIKQLNPTAKTLAFPIAKRASGFFGVLEFQLEPEKLLEIKELIVKDGKIVRHMILVKEPVRIRRERRGKKPAQTVISETKAGESAIAESSDIEKNQEESASAKSSGATKEKVELKDIEDKLEEILG